MQSEQEKAVPASQSGREHKAPFPPPFCSTRVMIFSRFIVQSNTDQQVESCSMVWRDHLMFIHSPVHGHLGCFRFFAVVGVLLGAPKDSVSLYLAAFSGDTYTIGRCPSSQTHSVASGLGLSSHVRGSWPSHSSHIFGRGQNRQWLQAPPFPPGTSHCVAPCPTTACCSPRGCGWNATFSSIFTFRSQCLRAGRLPLMPSEQSSSSSA